MNKFGMVLGIAAVATLAGCKDPEYKHANASSQDEVKNIETTPAPVAKPVVTTVEVKPATPKCTCLPGTKHTEPCRCGDPMCQCVVETKPVVMKPVEPEYTTYVVQSGDYLAKISKKFNVTLAAIRRANPSIKKDVIRIGQKIKIPGKAEAAAASAEPAVAVAPTKAATASAKKPVQVSSAAYKGATKEYVVKGGDTLGSIAYGNGINIRQLKALNGLTSDTVKVGQKLKVPAEKVVKAASAAAPATAKSAAKQQGPAAEPSAKPEVAAEAVAGADKPVTADQGVEQPAATVEKAAEPAKSAEPAKAAKTTNYVVAEGDDMTGVSIRWGVSAAEIRELNNMSETDQLVPGQVIKLPAEAQQ